MEEGTRIGSGAKWEDLVGYSRGIRVGNTIEIAGTTASNENGEVLAPGDAGGQTRIIIQIAENALKQLGGRLENVVRTRIFTTDITCWEEIGKAHGEYFRHIKPVATMVEVSKLIQPGLLVEMEFTAIISD